MTTVVGDIAVRVGADVSPLQRDMRQGQKSVRDFEKTTQEMAANVAKAGAAIVAAMATVAGGVLAMAKEAAAAGVEIKNLSDVANTTTDTFQRMADASKTVGIEQEKLADILKDVNDKVADFLETGGGPMADFFENIAPQVGVTADQFARLSGPEALQLYVNSLEDANLSQQQMTFYMEALASDATALLPLLRDNGSEMARLGDEAERAGRIMDAEMIAAAAELDREMTQLTDTLRMNATKAVLEHKDELLVLVGFITDTLLPAIGNMVDLLGNVADGWRKIGEAAEAAIAPMTRALGLSEALSTTASETPENLAARQADVDRTNAMGGGDESLTGTRNFDPFTSAADQPLGGAGIQAIPGITTPALQYSGRGDAAGPSFDDALQAFLDERKRALEAVEEEEEAHAGRVQGIRHDSADVLAEIETMANQDRLNSTKDAFSGLTGLMSSGNEKLFKIGQAAAIAEATVSGYQAATNAWQKGMAIGGPPLATAFSGASLLRTASLIQGIQSASIGGSSSGASSGGSSTPSATTSGGEASEPAQRREIAIYGDTFSRSQFIDGLEFMNEGVDNGAVIKGRR